MGKRPSELNVVDRIFYDIKVHGIDSVLENKDFYKTYKRVTKADEILKGYPSVKIGLDDFYGRQTVINIINESLSVEQTEEKSLIELFTEDNVCKCGHCKQSEN